MELYLERDKVIRYRDCNEYCGDWKIVRRHGTCEHFDGAITSVEIEFVFVDVAGTGKDQEHCQLFA